MVIKVVLSYNIETSENVWVPMTSVNITYENGILQNEFQTTMQETFYETKQNSKGKYATRLFSNFTCDLIM